MAQTPFEPRICEYSKCRERFTPKRETQRYHKPGCRMADWTRRHPRKKPKAVISNDRYLFGRELTIPERRRMLAEAAVKIGVLPRMDTDVHG